jgi:predicted nucleic acid-binding protein
VIDLDANFLIAVIERNREAEAALERWIQEGEEIAMSSVAWSEFLCGPVSLAQQKRAKEFVSRVEAFTLDDATLAAELFNATGRRQRSHADCMIAAAAIRRASTIATFDRSGFAQFEPFNLRLLVL